MGLFIKNHGKSDTPVITWQNNNQNVDQTGGYIQTGVNSIFGLLTKISDGRGGDDDDGDDAKVSNKTQEKIDGYQSQIDAKLKDAGVESIDGFKDKIEESKNLQKDLAQDKINLDTEIGKMNGDIQSKKSEITYLKGFLTGNASNDTATQNKIKGLENEIAAIEKNITEINKKKENLDKEIKKEQIHQQEIVAQKAEVENLQHNIDKLKKQLPKEVSYNVKKETDDLAAFTSALKNFKENQNQETADALYNAYHGGHNGVQNKTAETAYKFVVSQYPQLFPKQ